MAPALRRSGSTDSPSYGGQAERGPTEKKWEVKGGRREEIVNVKVNVNEKAKGGNRKKTLRSLRLSGKKPRIIDLGSGSDPD